jgi:NAD(P)-dependent dehydrogenase (short-subunit alcohol dehydrogenase family)
MSKLTKKPAVFTGASRGIRRATALALTNPRAHVLVHKGSRNLRANPWTECLD